MIKNTFLAFLALCTFSVNAQGRFDDVEINIVPIKGGVYALFGAGGNIGISVGEDGMILVDTQYSELSPKIIAALTEKFPSIDNTLTLNTHYHGDHTGGNAAFGQHSYLISHENVRRRLAKNDTLPMSALPKITYNNQMSLYLNNNLAQLVHSGPAHTDGDTAVIWTELNVVHTGDLFFKDRFPYIDLSGGGSVEGYLRVVDVLIDGMNSETIIIPGHGQLANKQDYLAFRDMLFESISWMRSMKSEGKSIEEIQALGVPSVYKNWAWSFITEERWINTLYSGL